AGVGDITVAVLALVLVVAVRPAGPWGRRLYSGWNVLGTVDILGVVGTAAAQGMTDPGSMSALLRLPLSLLATFLLPLIIARPVLPSPGGAEGVADRGLPADVVAASRGGVAAEADGRPPLAAEGAERGRLAGRHADRRADVPAAGRFRGRGRGDAPAGRGPP